MPDSRLGPPSLLTVALRARGSAQLAEIVAAVERDLRWGWLALDFSLLLTPVGHVSDDGLRVQVEQWLRLKGVRVVMGRAGRE